MTALTKEDLQHITSRTLRHYDDHADSFWEGTRDHDVSQNYEAFLGAMKATADKLRILDLGCGPGRDVSFFHNQGHEAIGLDGSTRFCEMARKVTGCTILHQDFLSLALKAEHFDGIFANAALFHVPRQELPRVLKELHAALKPDGILFTSNPRGSGEGWHGERYGTYLEFADYQNLLNTAGFRVLQHYYRPKDQPRDQQPWLAVVSLKI